MGILEIFHSLRAVDVWEFIESLISGLGNLVGVVAKFVSSDSSCEVHVFLHHRDSVGVDGTEIGVFEDTGEIGFS